MYNNVNKHLADYLKSKSSLNRLMVKLKDKYISLSRPSGTVVLENITREESFDISNILGKRLFEGDTIKISFKELTKKINEGKYHDFNWSEMFNYYFEKKLITKQERNINNKNLEYLFFENIYEKNKNNLYIEKVKELIINNDGINKIIKRKYCKDKDVLQKELDNIFLLLDNIPTKPTSLAVYSSITGNPHYLDLNRSTCTLFLKILSFLKNISYDDNIESKINILSEINVYTDPISNFVITYKLIGNKILDELNNNNEVVNLNLLNLNNLNLVSTDCKKVYIFENPSMLTSLLDLNVPIVITSGIPNVSLYYLLDKLEKSGNELFYNGDYDPEGLLIAEKLKVRFSNLKLICYDEIDYNCAKGKEKISNTRLKKLDKINLTELTNVKNLLLENSVAGYQEQNLIRIRNYIQKYK